MSTQLRDELARLAESTPTATPPAGLWERGVRRRRRGRAATALAATAAVVGAVLASTVGWDTVRTSSEPPPAAASDGAIPARLETPSRFTASTAGAPIGPLAVIAGAERATGWWGRADGLVGVSATSGEYRFLDLPDRVDAPADALAGDALPVLSPDGRSVAYWLGQDGHADRVGGFAVYDTVTGEVTRHEVDSGLGLWAAAMVWLDPGTVLVTFGEVTEVRSDAGAGRDIRSRVWSPSADRLTDLQDEAALWQVSPLTAGFADHGRRAVRFWNSRTGQRVGRVAAPDASQLQLLVDPSGRTAVGARQPETLTSRLFVGTVGDTVVLDPLRMDVEVWDLLGWQDADHVVARGVVPGSRRQKAAVYAIDLRTGGATELVREAREPWGAFAQYASDLWDHPTVDRPGPGRVLDPRLRAAGAGVLVLVAGAAVRLVRRRRARA